MFDLASSGVQIVMPDGHVLFDSGLQCTAQWHQQVARRQQRGLVVIVGSAAPTPDAAMEMIASGQASWVRASVELA